MSAAGAVHAQLGRLAAAFSFRNRRRKAAIIVGFLRDNGLRSSIVVGLGGLSRPYVRVVERAVDDHAKVVTAIDIWPDVGSEWPYVQGDGRQLPFRDDAVDVVVSNAVIEHVGSEEDQRRFLAEHARVGRCYVVTTPNRWFPIESHTLALFRHWSPSWRDACPEFTRLLSLREFKALLPRTAEVRGRPWSATFTALVRPE